MIRRLFYVFCLLSFPFLSGAQADIEPPLEEIVSNYFVVDVEGAGNVKVLKENQSQWQQAIVGTRLEEGDRIAVGDDTEVVLSLKSHTLVHLDEDTEMGISQLEENQSEGFLSRLKLMTGSILSDVKKNLSESRSSFEVEAGGVICGVRGTVFEVANNGGQVQTSTDEGVVEVKTSQGSQEVRAGQTSLASGGRFPSVRASSGEIRARFQSWRLVHQRLRQRALSRKNFSKPLGLHPGGENRLGRGGSAGGGRSSAVRAAFHAPAAAGHR